MPDRTPHTPSRPGAADLVIEGGTVLVHDDHDGIGFAEDAAVVVRNGRIDAVTTAAAVADLPAAERLDARGRAVLSGLINCHTHAPMVLFRGSAEDLPIEEWFNERITTSLAPHAPYTVSDADLRATAGLARDHGLPVHLHAAENREQTEHSLARHGRTPIETPHRTGLLDVDVLIAHGTGILERDLPVLGSATARVGVATAPRSHLKFAWDTTPVRLLRSIGVPVGLATDGAASNNTLDVWESMTLTALMQKAAERDADRKSVV